MINNIVNKKILIGLTTILNPDWRKSIEDLNKFGIEEIALFPTVLEKKERQEMYKLLEESSVISIPHIHLRSDMNLEELEFLIKKFKAEVFNIHSVNSAYPTKEDYKYIKKDIFIENTDVIPIESELKECGGLCVDFSHWEISDYIFKGAYANFIDLVEKYKIGCAHISAVPIERNEKNIIKSQHYMRDLKELDYAKKYRKYMPEFISIELSNPIKELVSAKKYLEEILNI